MNKGLLLTSVFLILITISLLATLIVRKPNCSDGTVPVFGRGSGWKCIGAANK